MKQINIKIPEKLLVRIPGNRSEFIRHAIVEKLDSANELRITVSPAIREWLENAAKVKRMTIADWLLSEFLLEARGWFANCPNCKKPTHDTREVPLSPDEKGQVRYIIECPFCGHEWEHVEDYY